MIEPKNLSGRIDVHAHYIPDNYRQALEAAGHSKPSGMPGIPAWSVEQHLSMMDNLGIQTSMLSISAPGLHFGDDQAARKLARYCNEEGAKAVHAHPDRFGLFAVLPLPDVEGSIIELDYALDVLHADGVVLETNFHGLYLGDERLERLFSLLNQRKTTLFIHPTDPHCPCCQDNKALKPLNYPSPMMEYMFETTRAVFNLILSGTLDRYPDIKVIVPHAGAAVPILAERVAAFGAFVLEHKPEKPLHESLRRLYYDLAGFPESVALDALLKIADPTHLLYGSDWPFTPEPLAKNLVTKLDETPLISTSLHNAIMRNNALAMFPRLAKA
ncbi:amidohydrolase [Pseudomonas sp. MAFF 301449]|uniref:6-methylsalicylate decarboxylase n=2 Tax=Pseudomonas cyclaminis TaxID=2781239 RepID=A0ABR9SSZ6_9PSED|nr:amidohydrolase [Pseudomonas cyclaminis]MBE8600135.1 amidohydrolase [Pseudomonas cyclaminis]